MISEALLHCRFPFALQGNQPLQEGDAVTAARLGGSDNLF
jgi:hypothetical protein